MSSELRAAVLFAKQKQAQATSPCNCILLVPNFTFCGSNNKPFAIASIYFQILYFEPISVTLHLKPLRITSSARLAPSMFSLARRAFRAHPLSTSQFRSVRTGSDAASSAPSARRRSKFSPSAILRKPDEKSEWWVVDGEMHEIGENVPLRERFVIPRDNIPNRRRKQLREQFMRRTRLVLKESDHETWCRRYMELYNELRETWEKLYWDDGYSKKLAHDRQNYDSAEEDDENFNPYRSRQTQPEQLKDNRERVNLLRDRFEYERDKRMRERAFAPMNEQVCPEMGNRRSNREPFDVRKYLSESDED